MEEGAGMDRGRAAAEKQTQRKREGGGMKGEQRNDTKGTGKENEGAREGERRAGPTPGGRGGVERD